MPAPPSTSTPPGQGRTTGSSSSIEAAPTSCLYEYEDEDLIARVRRTGAHVSQGIFSDISYMEHLGTKALNWGVGYHDYHSVRGFAYLDDTFEMVARYMKFHQQNVGIQMPHTPTPYSYRSSRKKYTWDDYLSTRPEEGDPGYVEGYFDDDGFWRDYDRERAGDVYADGPNPDDVYSDDDGILYDSETYREVYDIGGGRFAYMSDDGRWIEGSRSVDEYEGETEYFDREYMDDPTMEEVQKVLQKMDEDRLRFTGRGSNDMRTG